MERALKRKPQEQYEAQEPYASEERKVGLPKAGLASAEGNDAAIDPPSQASEPQEVSRRRQDRIVMEGIRDEVSIADLCRRECIHPTIY
jgi:hypothetical protein